MRTLDFITYSKVRWISTHMPLKINVLLSTQCNLLYKCRSVRVSTKRVYQCVLNDVSIEGCMPECTSSKDFIAKSISRDGSRDSKGGCTIRDIHAKLFKIHHAHRQFSRRCSKSGMVTQIKWSFWLWVASYCTKHNQRA